MELLAVDFYGKGYPKVFDWPFATYKIMHLASFGEKMGRKILCEVKPTCP